MKPCGGVPAVPARPTVIELMSIGSPEEVLGMSSMTVLRPRSLWRSSAPDSSTTLGSSPPTGRSTIPNRAGSPVSGVML